MVDSITLFFLEGKFVIGLLMFVRLAGFFVSAPFFRFNGIVPQMKIFLGVIIAASLTTAFWKEQPTIDFHLWNLVFLAMKEFFVGLAIGFSASTVFFAARFAGGVLDFEIGFQTSLLFSSDESPTLIGELKEMITLMIFLIINGHHFLIESIYASVVAVPIGAMEMTGPTIKMLTTLAATVLIIGIKMAAPVLIALFLTNLGLVLLARVAPQTNVFALSFQLKVVVGLVVLAFSIPLFVLLAKNSLTLMESETMKLVMTLNPNVVH